MVLGIVDIHRQKTETYSQLKIDEEMAQTMYAHMNK
jgi:hypothetical protein